MTQKYDVVYSVGASCASANFLKVFNLRKSSGPFDWIIGGSFKSRADLILHNFESYFELNDFNPIINNGADKALPPDPTYIPYENIKTGLRYYHDFPVEDGFKESYKTVKEKYDRRIARFYKSIDKAERVLFVWTEFGDALTQSDIEQIATNIQKYFGKQIDFLVIQNDRSMSSNAISTIEINANVLLYRANIEYFDDGSYCGWQGNLDLVYKIFKKYKLSGPRWRSFYRSCHMAVMKIIIMFTPSRKMRHRLRDKMRDW